MMDQVQGAVSGLEQYRMAMHIIKMWGMYKMHAMIAFGILFLITVVLYMRKNSWKKLFLVLTILTGFGMLALEGFKMYVAQKAVTTEIVQETTSMVQEPMADMTKGDMMKPMSGMMQKAPEVK